MAATIGARLGAQIREGLDGDIRAYYWSDSTTALSWIRNTEEWSTFVWNRTHEIRLLTQKDSWKHVPGEVNPADLPSRGCTPKQLAESRWWEGPAWLYENIENWPQVELNYDNSEIDKERKGKMVTTIVNVSDIGAFYKYFSKYQRTVRLIAWTLRFVNNCRNRGNWKRGELTSQEFDQGEKKLIWFIQQESFSKQDNRLKTINVFQDEDGILRVESKISRMKDLQNFRFPYILPADHLVVKRLIFDTHANSSHIGIQGLLSLLRERYWILGGRRAIRSVISACVICKRYNVKKLEVSPSTLPPDRVRAAFCFEVTRIDFAGPLYVKGGRKAWICLYTCAVYRAVHLETVTTLSTAGFIRAFRRFVARRGRPRIVYSDNGTNFRGAENIFEQLNWEEIKTYSAVQRIQWRFNPPSAPWWGGWWERLIGILKQLLRKVLGRAQLSEEELYTVLCDCESTINSRPLTYVSNDVEELKPLTPAMFLRELVESGVPDCDLADVFSLNKRFKYLGKIRDDLRKRFRAEYLGQLRQTVNQKGSRSVKVGEIVLIGNDHSKRLDWPLGKVVELFTAKDGKVRLARVQTQHGQLLRPVQRLYPLECVQADTTSEPQETLIPTAEEESSEVKAPATSILVDEEQSGESAVNNAAKGERVSRFGRKIKVPERYIE